MPRRTAARRSAFRCFGSSRTRIAARSALFQFESVICRTFSSISFGVAWSAMSPPLNPTEVQSRTDGRATLFNSDQFALPIRSIAGLAQVQEPEGTGGEAGGGGGVGQR